MKVESFDPSNGDKTKLCIQRTDYLQTEPLPVHGDSEVAEVDGVVGLDSALASWGGGAPHLLAAAHVRHLITGSDQRVCLVSPQLSGSSTRTTTDLLYHPLRPRECTVCGVVWCGVDSTDSITIITV